MILIKNSFLNMEGDLAKQTPSILVAPLKGRHDVLDYLPSTLLAGEFKGVNTFLNYLNTDMPEAKYQKESSSTEDGDFHTFDSYSEAMDVFLKNPRSIRKFTEKDDLLDGGDSAGKQVIFDVTGDFLDIGRHLEGEPEAFGSMTNGNPRAKRVVITLNLSWWCGVDESVINVRCSRIVRLIDWLESQQIRCRVVAVESTEMSHLELIVKDFDEVLDLNDIAVVSHSEFLRRAIFRFKEWSNTPHFGYGSPKRLSESVSGATFLPEYNTEYGVFIDSQVTSSAKIEADFDNLEEWLTKALSDDNLQPEERVMMALR